MLDLWHSSLFGLLNRSLEYEFMITKITVERVLKRKLEDEDRGKERVVIYLLLWREIIYNMADHIRACSVDPCPLHHHVSVS